MPVTKINQHDGMDKRLCSDTEPDPATGSGTKAFLQHVREQLDGIAGDWEEAEDLETLLDRLTMCMAYLCVECTNKNRAATLRGDADIVDQITRFLHEAKYLHDMETADVWHEQILGKPMRALQEWGTAADQRDDWRRLMSARVLLVDGFDNPATVGASVSKLEADMKSMHVNLKRAQYKTQANVEKQTKRVAELRKRVQAAEAAEQEATSREKALMAARSLQCLMGDVKRTLDEASNDGLLELIPRGVDEPGAAGWIVNDFLNLRGMCSKCNLDFAESGAANRQAQTAGALATRNVELAREVHAEEQQELNALKAEQVKLKARIQKQQLIWNCARAAQCVLQVEQDK